MHVFDKSYRGRLRELGEELLGLSSIGECIDFLRYHGRKLVRRVNPPPEADSGKADLEVVNRGQSMRVRLVCYEDVDAWILGKFASKLCENLLALGVDADIAKTTDRSADINHHVIYYDYDGQKSSLDTVMVTHIDTKWKLKKLKSQLENAVMGVCMSSDTVVKLADGGVPRDRLCFVTPAHDGDMVPRKIVFGITSKVQPTGCKREAMLDELADRIAPDLVAFQIMGAGWDPIVERLRARGFHVDYTDHFDRALYHQLVPRFDYYLYFGQDEGSMGYIDALAAGVPTIVTPQGFHLDVAEGITHPFDDLDELVRIFDQIAARKRRRVKAVSTWTWRAYARRHLALWSYLLEREKAAGRSLPPPPDVKALGVVETPTELHAESMPE